MGNERLWFNHARYESQEHVIIASTGTHIRNPAAVWFEG